MKNLQVEVLLNPDLPSFIILLAYVSNYELALYRILQVIFAQLVFCGLVEVIFGRKVN